MVPILSPESPFLSNAATIVPASVPEEPDERVSQIVPDVTEAVQATGSSPVLVTEKEVVPAR